MDKEIQEEKRSDSKGSINTKQAELPFSRLENHKRPYQETSNKRKRHHSKPKSAISQFFDIEAEADSQEDEAEEENFLKNDGFVIAPGREHDDEEDEGEGMHEKEDGDTEELRQLEIQAQHRLALRHHQEQQRRQQEDLLENVQAEAERIRQKYGASTATRAFAGKVGEEARGASGAQAALILPTMSDPKLWLVKCKQGKERLAANSLLAAMQGITGIMSADRLVTAILVPDFLSGHVYIEARKASDIAKAIQAARIEHLVYAGGATGASCTVVPSTEVLDVVGSAPATYKKSTLSQLGNLTPGTWVRVRRGRLAGDLAVIVDHHTEDGKLFVKMIPRDLNNTPRLFEAKSAGSFGNGPLKRARGGFWAIGSGQVLYGRTDGLAYRSLAPTAFTPYTPGPQDDFSLWPQEVTRPSLTTTSSTSLGHSVFRPGDRVTIREGELVSMNGTVKEVIEKGTSNRGGDGKGLDSLSYAVLPDDPTILGGQPVFLPGRALQRLFVPGDKVLMVPRQSDPSSSYSSSVLHGILVSCITTASSSSAKWLLFDPESRSQFEVNQADLEPDREGPEVKLEVGGSSQSSSAAPGPSNSLFLRDETFNGHSSSQSQQPYPATSPSRPAQSSFGGRRLQGRPVTILGGPYKGYKGEVVRSCSSRPSGDVHTSAAFAYAVRLQTNGRVVNVEQHLLAPTSSTDTHEASRWGGKTPTWEGASGRTPAWGGKTPAWGGSSGKTPAWGTKTPAWHGNTTNNNKTPAWGGAAAQSNKTPAWGASSNKTPAWGGKTPVWAGTNVKTPAWGATSPGGGDQAPSSNAESKKRMNSMNDGNTGGNWATWNPPQNKKQ